MLAYAQRNCVGVHTRTEFWRQRIDRSTDRRCVSACTRVRVCGGTSISVWVRCDSSWLFNRVEGWFFLKNGNDRDWERYWGCGDLHPRPGQNGKEKAEKRKRSKESQKDQGQWVTAIPVQRRLVQGSPDRADKKGLLPSPEVRLVQESPKKNP